MSDYSIIFAKDPVWVQTTRSGFRNQIFVMYHSTKREYIQDILTNGLKVSDKKEHLVLGSGLYVSRDLNKAKPYGHFTLKLLVYPGKTKTVVDPDDPLKTEWQQEFSSAWIPPKNRVTGSQLEETCVKSAAQVRILGLVRGWEFLPNDLKRNVKNAANTGDTLDKHDNYMLESMLEDLGIVYSKLVNMSRSMFLEATPQGEVQLSDWNDKEEQEWSRTWDNCYENKKTGLVLTRTGNKVVMEAVNMQIDRRQKWRMDGRGRLVHKESQDVLHSGNVNCQYTNARSVHVAPLNRGGGAASCDYWKFRCLHEIREKDDFVNFTPWHNMIAW